MPCLSFVVCGELAIDALNHGAAVQDGSRKVVIVGRHGNYGLACKSMHDVYSAYIDLMRAEELRDAGERAGLVGQMKD